MQNEHAIYMELFLFLCLSLQFSYQKFNSWKLFCESELPWAYQCQYWNNFTDKKSLDVNVTPGINGSCIVSSQNKWTVVHLLNNNSEVEKQITAHVISLSKRPKDDTNW